MSHKWWNSTDTLLLASLFNMVSREFFGALRSLFMSSRAGGGKVWKEQEGERCWSRTGAAWSLWEAAPERKGLRWEPCSIRGAATMGTDPQHPPHPHGKTERGRGGREREVWGEATGIITWAGLIAINIKNQINMSRCVFHFSHVRGT